MNKSDRSAAEIKHAPSKSQSNKNAQFHTKHDAISMFFFKIRIDLRNGGDPDFILFFLNRIMN